MPSTAVVGRKTAKYAPDWPAVDAVGKARGDGYGRRSLIEAANARFKRATGAHLASRRADNQQVDGLEQVALVLGQVAIIGQGHGLQRGDGARDLGRKDARRCPRLAERSGRGLRRHPVRADDRCH